MYIFLIPLILGFVFNIASSFTNYFTRVLGNRWGVLVTIVMRNFLGIPLWAIGLILAYGYKEQHLFPLNIVIVIAGWVVMIAGILLIVAAMFSIQTRAGAPRISDKLAQKGVYAHIRHPVYAGVFLEVAGLFLLNPTRAFGLATLLAVLWLPIQAWVEEIDLVQRMPEYREYMQRVPGFVPRLARGEKR
jgi:protein-S-isoprenylcysteine O-methyltransferase Ste14